MREKRSFFDKITSFSQIYLLSIQKKMIQLKNLKKIPPVPNFWSCGTEKVWFSLRRYNFWMEGV